MSSRIHVKSLMSVWHSNYGTAFILVGTLITPLSSFSLNLEQFQMVEALSHLEEMAQKILMVD